MRRIARPAPLLAVLLVAAAPVVTAAPGLRAAAPRSRAEELREVADLLTTFRRSKADPAAREEVVARVLEIGDAAPQRLLKMVNREVQPLQARYRAAFLKGAGDAIRANLGDRTPQDLETLRATVRSVTRNPTKESIVAKADPALKELEDCLVVTPADVLAVTPALAGTREELVRLGGWWQRLTDAAGAAPAGEAAPYFVALLAAQEELAALMALARNDLDRRTLMGNVALAEEIGPEEASGIRRLNRIRLVLGMKPLRIDVRLCDAARGHSKDMAEKGFFDHVSPVAGKRTFTDRAKAAGTSAHAENIAMGARTGPGAIQQWWHSPGHLKNMMGSHSRVGLGRHGKHWTQLFG